MKRIFPILAILFLAACQNTNQDSVYTQDSVGVESYAEHGVVASMRSVTVKTQRRGGPIQSGVISGSNAAVRSTIGTYSGGGILGSIGASVGGAVANDMIRSGVNDLTIEEPATEFIIKKEYETVILVQKNNEGLKQGDKVILVTDQNGKTRILPDEM